MKRSKQVVELGSGSVLSFLFYSALDLLFSLTIYFSSYFFSDFKLLSIYFKDLFVYFRENEHKWEGQREKERESQADSMRSLTWGSASLP